MVRSRTISAGFTLLAILAILIAIVPFAGSTGAGAQEAVTLRFWTTEEDNFAPLVEQFQAEHPGITIEAQYVGNYDDMSARIQTAIVGNELPDVAQVGQRYGIPQMVDAGVVIPVDEYLSEADVADIHDGLWSRYTYRDGRWAIPFQSSTPGLWFNATMMKAAGLDPETPPRTWDDVVAAGKAMTRDTNGDGQIDQWGFGTCDDIPWYQRPMVLQAGGTLVNPEGTVAVNSPEAVEMLTWFKDAVHTHKISPPLAQQTARDDFSAGKYGMIFRSTASRLSFQEDVGDAFELGVAFLPENKRRAVGVGGNALIAVRTGDDAREAAAKTFVQWLTDTERAVGISLDSGYVPIRESALADARIAELANTDPLVATIYDQLQYVADSSISPADSLIWDGFLNGVETVQTDPQADPQAVLDALQGEIDEYMSTYE